MKKTQFLPSMRFQSPGANDNQQRRKIILLCFFTKGSESPVRTHNTLEDKSVTSAPGDQAYKWKTELTMSEIQKEQNLNHQINK